MNPALQKSLLGSDVEPMEGGSMNPLVSTFANAYAKKPRDVPLSQVLADIRGDTYRARIGKLRQLSPADYNEHKKDLPAFTISGTCIDRKTAAVHSNLLQVDLDDLSDSLESLHPRLMRDPHIAFGFVSPSGRGLKLAIAIDGQRHAESFASAEIYFAATYNAPIDPKVKDRLRLCFVSHDPNLWENPQPVFLPLGLQSSTESTESLLIIGDGVSCSVNPDASCSVKSLADAVAVSLPSAPRRNNQSLFKLARALLAAGREKPLNLADRMSAFSEWYDRTGKLGFLRDGQTRDHYLTEFLHAMRTATTPLDESPIEAAWRNVQIQPKPSEAEIFDTEPPRQITSLCFQLERSSGGKPWFLSCRDAARLTGISHTAAAGWLSGFIALGLLEATERGTKQRATRYRWKGSR